MSECIPADTTPGHYGDLLTIDDLGPIFPGTAASVRPDLDLPPRTMIKLRAWRAPFAVGAIIRTDSDDVHGLATRHAQNVADTGQCLVVVSTLDHGQAPTTPRIVYPSNRARSIQPGDLVPFDQVRDIERAAVSPLWGDPDATGWQWHVDATLAGFLTDETVIRGRHLCGGKTTERASNDDDDPGLVGKVQDRIREQHTCDPGLLGDLVEHTTS